MKIKRTKHRKVKPIIAVAALAILTCVAFYHLFMYQSSTAPGPVNVPTVVKDPSAESSDLHNDKQTKVEGKTPAQYSNETTNDTPAYSNEQFRIPD